MNLVYNRAFKMANILGEELGKEPIRNCSILENESFDQKVNLKRHFKNENLLF
jgi:hypothetical protein